MPSLGDWITKWSREGFGGAIDDRRDELAQAAQAGGNVVNQGLGGAFGGGGGLLREILALLPGELGLLGKLLAFVTSGVGKSANFMLNIAEGWTLGGALIELTRPAIQPAVHTVNDWAQTEIYDPNTAAGLEARRLIDNAMGRSEAAGGNLSGEHYDRLVNAAYQQPGLDVLLELQRRRLSGDADTTYGLQRAGMDPGFVEKIKGLVRQLLSPADLALANLRGELDDATTFDYGNQLGVDEFDMRVLIGNTGEPPGAQELQQALRRGIVDPGRFERGIRQSRVRNEWIDVMEALRFAPPTVGAVLNMRVRGFMEDGEARTLIEQNGIDPKFYGPLLESSGRPISGREAELLFHRGAMTGEQVDQAIRESDIKNKYIPYVRELGRRLIPGRTITAMLNHGVIKHDLAIEKLRQLGYDQQDAVLLANYGTHEHVAQAKDLTKTDILALFRDSILTGQQAKSRLEGLGYTGSVADYLIRLERAKQQASVIRTEQTRIRGSLLAHRIDKAEAIKQLVASGIDRGQAEGLVARWEHEHGAATRTLTEAQVLRILKAKLISAEDARRRLQALGLAHDDATLLLQAYGYLRT